MSNGENIINTLDVQKLEILLKTRQKKLILLSHPEKEKVIPIALLKKFGSLCNCNYISVSGLPTYLYADKNLPGKEKPAGIKEIEQAMCEILSDTGNMYLKEIYRRPAFFSRAAATLNEIYSSSLSEEIFSKSDSEKWKALKHLSEEVKEQLVAKGFDCPETVYRKAIERAGELKDIILIKYNLFTLLKKDDDIIAVVKKNNPVYEYSEAEDINTDIRIAPQVFPEAELHTAMRFLSEQADEIKAGNTAIYLASYNSYVSALKDLSDENGLNAVFAKGLPLTNFRPVTLFCSMLEMIRKPLDVQPFLETITHPSFSKENIAGDLGLDNKPSISSIRSAVLDIKKNRTIGDFRMKLEEILNSSEDKESYGYKVIKYVYLIIEKLSMDIKDMQESTDYDCSAYTKIIDDTIRINNEDEAGAVKAIKMLLEELKDSVKLKISGLPAEELITNQLLNMSTSGSSPDGENIYIAPVEAYVPGAFERVAVIGLSDSVIPGKYGTDPVFFQEERAAVNSPGSTIFEDEAYYYGKKKKIIRDIIHGKDSQLLVSWPLNDPVTGEETEVSRYLEDYLGKEKVSIKHESSDVLSLHENRFGWRKYPGDSDRMVVNSLYPVLKYYTDSIKNRKLAADNMFRGVTDNAVEDNVFSASMLKKLLSCSYAFFLDEILFLEGTDYAERNPFEWLDSGTSGKLLHHIYFRTFSEGKMTAPEMKEIAEEEILKEKEKTAVPSEYLYRAFYKKIMTELDKFAEKGFSLQSQYKPRWFEVGVGTKRGKDPELHSDSPVDFKGIRLKGVIDRIDTNGVGNYLFIDYKTGSNKTVKKDEFSGAEYIQHVIYPVIFRGAFGGKFPVEKIMAGYYFCSSRAYFTRTHFELDEKDSRERFAGILEPVLEGFKKGNFNKSNMEDCKYCGFMSVCHDGKVKKF